MFQQQVSRLTAWPAYVEVAGSAALSCRSKIPAGAHLALSFWDKDALSHAVNQISLDFRSRSALSSSAHQAINHSKVTVKVKTVSVTQPVYVRWLADIEAEAVQWQPSLSVIQRQICAAPVFCAMEMNVCKSLIGTGDPLQQQELKRLHTINNTIVTTNAAGSYTDEKHASATVPGQRTIAAPSLCDDH
eukprot:3520-Heterococcus_DN1.PRE.1